MRVFRKVTIRTLKLNRTRTAVTMIGVILSASMICSVTTLVSSFRNYLKEDAVYTSGDWHGRVQDTLYETYEEISASDQVGSTVWIQQLGYAATKGVETSSKPYIYLLGASENVQEMLPIHILSGRYPAAQNEILLPVHFCSGQSNGLIAFDPDDRVDYSMGDTLTLALGERMFENRRLTQQDPFREKDETTGLPGETLEVRETRTYTVVGFYERPGFVIEGIVAPGYTALTAADQTLPENCRCDVYFKMENLKDIYAFMKEGKLSGTVNTTVLRYSGIFNSAGYETELYGLAAIIVGLIVFGSVALIYNAFSISVSERTRQFGLLSSVGATKKQLRSMVLFEALTVSALGIPIGILCGIGGIGVTLIFVGRKFTVFVESPVEMKLSVSAVSVVTAAVIALITAFISAWIPAKRATKISAVEAIRQNRDIQEKESALKTPKTICKLFGTPGMLADRYFKRSRKKYRATVLSLFMSIVLFISAVSFSEYFSESVDGGLLIDGYDIIVCRSQKYFSKISPDRLLELLRGANEVTDVVYGQTVRVDGYAQKKDLTKRYLSAHWYRQEGVPEDLHSMGALVSVIDDAEFERLLAANGLEKSLYMNSENPLALAIDGAMWHNDEDDRYETMNMLTSDTFEFAVFAYKQIEGYAYLYDVTDESGKIMSRYSKSTDTGEQVFLDIPFEESHTEYTLKSGKTIYEKPIFYRKGSGGILVLVYPQSLKTAVFPEELFANEDIYFYLTADNQDAAYSSVRAILSENGFGGNGVINYADYTEQDRNLVSIVRVFTCGFVTLLSMIAAANVFNTVATNINLRRREFAMLKSVGMTAKGLYRMMNFECLLYGSRALLFGLPVSAGVTYLIYLSVANGYKTSFRLPWTAMGIAAIGVFFLVSLTMLYAMNRIRRDNPIDALKNENL